MPQSTDLLQGTLDLLILQTLALEPMHGWGVAQRIQQLSKDVLQVGQGSLYPALYRLEYKGWIRSEWQITENNRRAKYYRLTPKGKKQLATELATWDRLSSAIASVLWPGRGGVLMISELLTRLRFLILRKKRGELDEELEFHLEQAIASRIAAGIDATEARRQALIEFGGIEPTREQCERQRPGVVDRHGAAGPSLCSAWVSTQSTFYDQCPAHDCARHRRDDRRLQRCGPHPVSAIAVCRSEPNCFGGNGALAGAAGVRDGALLCGMAEISDALFCSRGSEHGGSQLRPGRE